MSTNNPASDLDAIWYTRCPVPTPLGIAVQLGWFRDEFEPEGITLRSIQETNDSQQRESHFNHNLANSFRQGGNIPAIWARSRGRDTKVIGLSWTDEFQAILTLPTTGIKTARDLRGRRIGLPVNPGSIDFNRASALRGFSKALEIDGLALRDVERVDVIAAPRAATDDLSTGDRNRIRARHGYRAETIALVRGDVDAIYVKGVLGLETARLIGARIVADIGFHPDPIVRINNGTPRTLTVDAGLLEARPDIVSRFLARVIDAGEWAKAHPDETATYIARETGSTSDWVRSAYGADVHTRLTTFLEEAAIDALSDFKDFLFNHGFLAQDFDTRAWIDPKPLADIARHARHVA